MNRNLSMMWTAVLVVSFAIPAAADDGWSFSDLNPFATKSKGSKASKSPPSRKISESKPAPKSSGWSLNPFAKSPPASPPTKTASSRRKSEPSTLTKTWEALTPWNDHPVKKPAPLSAPRPTAKGKGKGEKGWLESMFTEEEPRKPKTVQEFLDQEKPEF